MNHARNAFLYAFGDLRSFLDISTQLVYLKSASETGNGSFEHTIPLTPIRHVAEQQVKGSSWLDSETRYPYPHHTRTLVLAVRRIVWILVLRSDAPAGAIGLTSENTRLPFHHFPRLFTSSPSLPEPAYSSSPLGTFRNDDDRLSAFIARSVWWNPERDFLFNTRLRLPVGWNAVPDAPVRYVDEAFVCPVLQNTQAKKSDEQQASEDRTLIENESGPSGNAFVLDRTIEDAR